MAEFVSCILPTRNRPAFLRQAIRLWLRQTYDEAELIVVDDGDEPVAEYCAGLLRVRYVRLDTPTSLGNKLNIGAQLAAGTIIHKLDDDDYYAPAFLEQAVGRLPRGGREPGFVAWDCFLVLVAGERYLRFSGHGWEAGGTLCFHRKLWEEAPFRDAPRAVDAYFIQDHATKPVRICLPELYILVRHGDNTWRTTHGSSVDAYFRRQRAYPKPIEALVEPLDVGFYRALAAGGSPR